MALHLQSGATTGAALGAARLGWLATLPQTAANFERVCVRPPIEKTFTPDRADTTLHELLAKRYARVRALYRATKPLMVAS